MGTVGAIQERDSIVVLPFKLNPGLDSTDVEASYAVSSVLGASADFQNTV